MAFWNKPRPEFPVGMRFYYIETGYSKGLDIREDIVLRISSTQDSESTTFTYYGRFKSSGVSSDGMFFTRREAEVARFNKFVDNLNDLIKTTNEKVNIELADTRRAKAEIYELLRKTKDHVEKRTK